METAFEAPAIPAAAADGGDDSFRRTVIERAKAGELLSRAELAAIFRLGRTRFFVLAKRGHFKTFEVSPVIGKKIYSGIKIYRYLCGDPIYEPTFGARRPRR